MASDVTIDVEQLTDTVFGEIERYLQSRIESADAAFRRAEDALVVERDALVAFHHDGTLPEQVIKIVSLRAHDAASDAAADVLAQRADRSVFDQAKAARDALDTWLINRGLAEKAGTAVESTQEPDTRLARRLISDHFDTCLNAARTNVEKARARLMSAREELAIFRRDRQVSAETADEV